MTFTKILKKKPNLRLKEEGEVALWFQETSWSLDEIDSAALELGGRDDG